MFTAVIQFLLMPLMYVWTWVRPDPAVSGSGQPQSSTRAERPVPPRRGGTLAGTTAPGTSDSGSQDDTLRNRRRPARGEAEPREKSSGER